MTKILQKISIVILMAISLQSCYYDNEEYLYPDLPGGECDTVNVSYSGVVAPIMAASCNSCHSPAAPSGNVTISTYDGLKASVNSGQFWKAINHESGASPMPQGGNKLPSCELKKIKAWIDAGAPQN
jgi:hypothetical protein